MKREDHKNNRQMHDHQNLNHCMHLQLHIGVTILAILILSHAEKGGSDNRGTLMKKRGMRKVDTFMHFKVTIASYVS